MTAREILDGYQRRGNCSFAGCERSHYALGLCQKHYNKRRYVEQHGKRGPRRYLRGDDWYRSRIDAGRDPVIAPGTHIRLPELGPTPLLVGLDDAEVQEMADREADTEDEALARVAASDIRNALCRLPERYRVVLELRFGLTDDGEELSLEDVGRELRITRERVRQIQKKALEDVRRVLLGESAKGWFREAGSKVWIEDR